MQKVSWLTVLTVTLFTCFVAPDDAKAKTDGSDASQHIDPLTEEALDLVASLNGCAPLTRCAADFFRLKGLLEWLEPHLSQSALMGIANGRHHALVRAQALWVVMDKARDRVDMETANLAAQSLGILSNFVYRSGKAPPPARPLEKSQWRVFPMVPGEGYAALDRMIRPANDTQGTLATRIFSQVADFAVLRLGFDDGVEVFWNGDRIYRSEGKRRASLDQIALPIYLAKGANHLRVNVRQKTGAWRLVARITDPQGQSIDVESDAEPWGPVPEGHYSIPAWEPTDLWAAFDRLLDADEMMPNDVRDAVEFALATHWPGKDRTRLLLEAEGAFEKEPSAANLRAWMRLLEPEKRALIRARQSLKDTPSKSLDDMMLTIEDGWDDFYSRRIQGAYTRILPLAKKQSFMPAVILESALLDDGGLAHSALAKIVALRATYPGRPAIELAYSAALRAAGRHKAFETHLRAALTSGSASISQRFELAELLSLRGKTQDAINLLDEMSTAQPGLWQAQMDAVDILIATGQRKTAKRRLEKLYEQVPGDPSIAEKLAALHSALGDQESASEVLDVAIQKHPRNTTLRQMRALLLPQTTPKRLGPPLSVLLGRSDPDQAQAHVLFHGIEVVVDADGRAKRRFRRVVRAVRAESENVRKFEILYLPSFQELTIEHAFLITKAGDEKQPRRSDRDLSEPSIRLYFDLRAETFDFGRIEVGDTYDVAWTLEDFELDPALPGHYGEIFFLQEALPRAETWFGFRSESPLSTAVDAHHLDPIGAPGVLRLENTPGVPYELFSPGRSSVHGYVHLSNVSDFDALSELYQGLIGSRLNPTAALARKAAQWTLNARGPKEKVAALYQKVANQIRYVGLEFGVHSFRPAWPEETLNRGFGDCKDRAALLIALSATLGIEAQFVLARTRPRGLVDEGTASMAIFDHALVYFPGLGKFLDPTADGNDPWSLPPEDQGAQVLVINRADKKAQGSLETIPIQSAQTQRSELRMDVKVRTDGRGAGQMRWTLMGHPATLFRRGLGAGLSHERVMENALTSRFPGVAMQNITISGIHPPQDPLVIEGRVEIPQFRHPETGRMPRSAAHGDPVSRFAIKSDRKGGFRLPHALLEMTELRVELPKTLKAKAGPEHRHTTKMGHSLVRTDVYDGGYSTTTHLEMNELNLTRDAYTEFRSWLGRMTQTLALPVESERNDR